MLRQRAMHLRLEVFERDAGDQLHQEVVLAAFEKMPLEGGYARVVQTAEQRDLIVEALDGGGAFLRRKRRVVEQFFEREVSAGPGHILHFVDATHPAFTQAGKQPVAPSQNGPRRKGHSECSYPATQRTSTAVMLSSPPFSFAR